MLLDREDEAFDGLEHAYEDGDRDHFEADYNDWVRAVACRLAYLKRLGIEVTTESPHDLRLLAEPQPQPRFEPDRMGVGPPEPIREQRLVFGEVADTYDRRRPSYPSSLVDAIVSFAGSRGAVPTRDRL